MPVLRGARSLGTGVRKSESEGRLAAIAMTVRRAVHVFSSRGMCVGGTAIGTVVLINYQSPADEGFCKILRTFVSIVNLESLPLSE